MMRAEAISLAALAQVRLVQPDTPTVSYSLLER
jgi:hypothetical protein